MTPEQTILLLVICAIAFGMTFAFPSGSLGFIRIWRDPMTGQWRIEWTKD